MGKFTVKPKFNRNRVPSKVLIGRLGKGYGDEEILTLDEVAHAIVQGNNPLSNPSANLKEFLGLQLDGLFAADEFHRVIGPPVKVQFPASGVVQDAASAIAAGTNTSHFYLVTDVADYLVNGTSLICTVTFTTGSIIGTFSYNGTVLVNAAQALYIVCDHTPDPTLAGVELVFCGSPL